MHCINLLFSIFIFKGISIKEINLPNSTLLISFIKLKGTRYIANKIFLTLLAY